MINSLNIDFTIKTYKTIISTLSRQGFSFSTFEESLSNKRIKYIVLRHDVDRLPENSLAFAKIQADLGIKGSYYFRVFPESINESIIKEIYSLGHEVGYHYEDLGAAAYRLNGVKAEEELVELAIRSFKENLEKLRQLVPVNTICMHGSPMSRWDSRLLWKYYDYHDFGIFGEPYFDIDFKKVMYLTDTGRRWDGDSINIRDKASGVGLQVSGKEMMGREDDIETKRLRDEETKKRLSVSQSFSPSVSDPAPGNQQPAPFPKFHSTFDIIKAAEAGTLPDQIIMTFHPQRWTDKPIPWVKELVWQNVKNAGKYFLLRVRS